MNIVLKSLLLMILLSASSLSAQAKRDSLLITGTGDFKIGATSSPAAKLHIVGAVQARQDSLHEYFLMDKAPASEYWFGFFQRFPNAQGVVLDDVFVPFGDTVDIAVEKVWRRQANEKTIVLPEKERQGLAFQKIFVVKDTSIVDCDVLRFSRITKNPGRKRFELIKLGARNYRLWEIPDVGPRINRGLHLGRPDDILIGPFKPKEDNAKKKIKEKVKVKTKIK